MQPVQRVVDIRGRTALRVGKAGAVGSGVIAVAGGEIPAGEEREERPTLAKTRTTREGHPRVSSALRMRHPRTDCAGFRGLILRIPYCRGTSLQILRGKTGIIVLETIRRWPTHSLSAWSAENAFL